MKITTKLIKVGIIVVAFEIEDVVLDRFTSALRENPGYQITPHIIGGSDNIGHIRDDGQYMMNKSKALNIGLRQCLKCDYDVIICADVDVLTPPSLIRYTCDIVLSNKCCFHAVVRNIDPTNVCDNYDDNPFDEWLQLPLRETSRGCWNAMTPEMWCQSGGYNEELFGWGYEDMEFHERLASKGILIHRETNFPLVHVNHPWRKQIRRNDKNREIAKKQDWTDHNWLIPQMDNKIHKLRKIKPVILCSAENAMGVGDGVMLLPTIRELAKTYTVKIMCSWPSHSIVNLIHDGHNIIVHNMNEQTTFYNNDHVGAFNLTYWQVFNTLRHFDHHAINMIRKCANLPIIKNEILEDIPVSSIDELKMKRFLDSLPKPIIVTHPFVSYWNKMLDHNKHLEILTHLSNIGTVVQIGGHAPEYMIHRNCINLVGHTSIGQSLAILKYADCFVGYDSFLQHASAAMKTPSVVMFCGTSPENFGYPFHKNIWHPNTVHCQRRCGRPQRWIFDYEFKDVHDWGSRDESGWMCPYKLCDKAITVDEVISAVNEQLEIGRDRDWTFFDYVEG